MCSMSPPPAATHVLSLLVKLLMALLMGSWGKLSQINSNAILNSFLALALVAACDIFSTELVQKRYKET